jgi:ABC-2 type transport system ATP-binding protein
MRAHSIEVRFNKKEVGVIEVTDLTKSYGPVVALAGISFRVNRGEIVGVLGPNGAGKSTVIRILTGYIQPDEGSVEVDGLDVLTHTREVQSRIGYLPETTPLYPELTVQSYLKMMADLREIPAEEQLARISEVVYDTSLEDHLTRPIGQLSKGYRQRVNLAQAILHRPRLLILDEPTVGLDPTQIVEIRNLIKRLAGQSTILFSSHILSEVEAICDRVIILMNGAIRADSHLAELSSTMGAILVLERDTGGVESALRTVDGAIKVDRTATPEGYPSYYVHGQEGVDLCPAIYHLARAKDWPVRELRRDVQTLESIFNQLAIAA